MYVVPTGGAVLSLWVALLRHVGGCFVGTVPDAAVEAWDPLADFNGNFLTDIPATTLIGGLFCLFLRIGAACVTDAVIIFWADAFRVLF